MTEHFRHKHTHTLHHVVMGRRVLLGFILSPVEDRVNRGQVCAQIQTEQMSDQ